MNITTQQLDIGHYQLISYQILPENREPHTMCLFTHGQGDYTRRYTHHYPALFKMMTQLGFGILSTDLPGHGASSGKRGHIDLNTIDSIHDDQLSHLNGLPFAFFGHSMGGLLTLRRHLRSLQNDETLPLWTWVNCPLLNPTATKPAWYIALAKIAAKILPKVTIKTGVSPELCHSNPTRNEKQKQNNHRISLHWANELLKMSHTVTKELPHLQSNIPLLITQGEADKLCSPAIAQCFFDSLQFRNKDLQLFPNMPHEPFAEDNNQAYLRAVKNFLLSHSQQSS